MQKTAKDRNFQEIENIMKPQPELLLRTQTGGTVHKYPLTGGKTLFIKYLGCHSGVCNFYDHLEDATSHIEDYLPNIN